MGKATLLVILLLLNMVAEREFKGDLAWETGERESLGHREPRRSLRRRLNRWGIRPGRSLSWEKKEGGLLKGKRPHRGPTRLWERRFRRRVHPKGARSAATQRGGEERG